MATAQSAYVLTYSHKHGEDVSLHATEGSATRAIAAIARSYWHEIAEAAGVPHTPAGLTDEQVIAMYFENYPQEEYHIEQKPIQRF